MIKGNNSINNNEDTNKIEYTNTNKDDMIDLLKDFNYEKNNSFFHIIKTLRYKSTCCHLYNKNCEANIIKHNNDNVNNKKQYHVSKPNTSNSIYEKIKSLFEREFTNKNQHCFKMIAKYFNIDKSLIDTFLNDKNYFFQRKNGRGSNNINVNLREGFQKNPFEIIFGQYTMKVVILINIKTITDEYIKIKDFELWENEDDFILIQTCPMNLSFRHTFII